MTGWLLNPLHEGLSHPILARLPFIALTLIALTLEVPCEYNKERYKPQCLDSTLTLTMVSECLGWSGHVCFDR